jgi:hypothetical protein
VHCQVDRDVRLLFADRGVVGTADVARFVGLSESIIREWARFGIFVARIRGAYAWTPFDVVQLVAYLSSEHEPDRATLS